MRRPLTVAVAALALTGCGGGDDPPPPARAATPLAAAAERARSAGGAQIVGRIIYELDGRRSTATLRGTADFAQERSLVRLDIPSLPEDPWLPYDELHDGPTAYYSNPRLRERVGARWAKIDVRALIAREVEKRGAEFDADQAAGWDSPAHVLRYLEAADGVERVGEGEVGGVPVTHYRGTVDIRRWAELAAPGGGAESAGYRAGLVDAARKQLGTDRLPLEAALDRDGHVRRQEFVMHMPLEERTVKTTVRMRFPHFGRQYRVELPPDAEVRDITDRIDEFRRDVFG